MREAEIDWTAMYQARLGLVGSHNGMHATKLPQQDILCCHELGASLPIYEDVCMHFLQLHAAADILQLPNAFVKIE